MKILIFSRYFWPENLRINDLTQELVQRGHNVALLTGIPNYSTVTVFEEYRPPRMHLNITVRPDYILGVGLVARDPGGYRRCALTDSFGLVRALGEVHL